MGCAVKAGRRTLIVFFTVLVGLGLAATGAGAHSRLTKSEPAAREVLDAPPKELKLWFNENVEPAFAKIWIVPSNGPQISLATRGDSSDKKLLIVTMPDNLSPGPVVIGYHVLSVDGHTIEDKLSFKIKSK